MLKKAKKKTVKELQNLKVNKKAFFKISKFTSPYTKEGKTTFRKASAGRSGVYQIKENGKLVYVGVSTHDLYRTLYRHFEKWTHPSQPVTTYHSKLNNKRYRYTVRIVICGKLRALALEKGLIKKYKPRDNDLLYPELKLTASQIESNLQYEKTVKNDNFEITEDIPF